MSKVKVLTVQFDVTDLSEDAIARLKKNLTFQSKFGNHITELNKTSFTFQDELEADLFNVSVREVDSEDV